MNTKTDKKGMNMKLKKYDKYPKFFFKYLISYIFILLIPIIIMAFLVYNYFISTLKNEVIDNTLNSLNKSKYIIDEQVNQLKNTSYQILNVNKNLRPIALLNDTPIKDIKIKDELYNYTATNTFIEEVVLHLRGDSNLYTSKGPYSFPMFTDNIYSYKNWSSGEFYRDIATISEPTVRKAENVNGDERYVTFVYPYIPNNGNPYAVLLFLIKEKSIQNLLTDNIKIYNGNSLILDQNNNIITITEDNDYIHSDEFFQFMKSKKAQDAKIVKLKDQKFFLCYTKSEETNWKYVALLPESLVMRQVFKVQMIFVYGLLIIILLGSILIYGSMYLNYKPLKQLKLYTEKIFKNSSSSLDELETVKETINFLTSQNGQLNNQIKNNYEALKNNLVFSALKGEIGSMEDFNKKGKEINVVLSKDLFRIIIIKVHSHSNSNSQSRVITLIEDSISEEFQCYGREHFEPNEYVMIVSYGADQVSSFYEEFKALHKKCKEKIGTQITIGVGNEYYELSDSPKSYIQASTAIKHRFVKGNDEIIFFDEVDVNKYSLKEYSNNEVQELKNYIKVGDIKKIESMLQNITTYIKENSIPLFAARGICFEIINIVTQTTKEMSSEFVVVKNEYPDIFLLEAIETVEEFIKLIKEICMDICTSIKKRVEKQEVSLIDQIVEYVEKNYDDCNFSIQDVADHFEMNLSYLSQYFKAKRNMTILEYITELRIIKAKKLLISNKLSLKYIAEKTGYYNVSSFIRRFKQVTGYTPGEYRDQYYEA